ncbi:3-oxoacyl-[acyl-carrier-protein] reductase FabG [Oligella ureolytica]|uniref:3-oxoacyl-[acyl-carrier-protein] reductase n=1 Tax=Oligella ureolytica TaxID=90244 RepID=A0A378XJR2_9BURK|nr:3-oxoacyl-ACP reductase FabG [Oligella ureolytica]QPT39625.1 3-oxoacyl-ACP reductase FabG [Oligella ureolytica]SUA56979.1 3-oxoacyl-[acyl-carrier-protein] reductase FabG [Oligella ureolytica]
MSEQVLKDKIALVTGASRGIGKAVAKALAEQGATVVGTATTEQGAEGITAELESFGGRGVVLNVTDNAACDELLAELAAEGGPHILVNNAGITRDNLAMRMKDEEWLDVMQTNLNAVFRLCRGVMRPMMKAREGRIINLTSVIASVGNPGQSNYAAAKAAVAGMSRSLASELGSRNITVNCVAPGFIDTDMTRSLSEEVTDSLLSRIPLSRFGQPEDIANAVVFLASPQASYITGTTLHVNGGMFMQ